MELQNIVLYSVSVMALEYYILGYTLQRKWWNSGYSIPTYNFAKISDGTQFNTLIFVLTSSLQAWRKSLPAETLSCSSGNSRTRCEGVTDFGSKLPRGGGWMVTFLFLALSAGCGRCNVARREGADVASSSVAVEEPATLALELSASAMEESLIHRFKFGDEAKNCPIILELFPISTAAYYSQNYSSVGE